MASNGSDDASDTKLADKKVEFEPSKGKADSNNEPPASKEVGGEASVPDTQQPSNSQLMDILLSLWKEITVTKEMKSEISNLDDVLHRIFVPYILKYIGLF